MDLFRLYHPLSANAFRHDEGYAEYPPSPALAPYVRCFWRSSSSRTWAKENELIIPDTCMDLLFKLRRGESRVLCRFCGLDDAAYRAPAGEDAETFGIRFYPWSAICFSDGDLRGSMGNVHEPDAFFASLRKGIEPRLLETASLKDRIALAESVLLRLLRPERMRPDMLNALHAMIVGTGALRTGDFASAVCVSSRQLERLMISATGAPPKRMAQLIRHQRIYRELVEGHFHPLDAVARYGYSDQSHLIRDFRRFHSMTPAEAQSRLLAQRCRISSIPSPAFHL